MSRWNKTCEEFKEVRGLIDSDDVNLSEIKEKLIGICTKYANEDWDFAQDFQDLADDIFDIEENEDEIDWALGEFYDLCDSARVWLDI